jgi:hypothetical protein
MTKQRQKPGRKPAICQSIELPLPPRGRDADWSSEAGRDLERQRPMPISGHVCIRILVGLVDERRNLDTIASAVLDVLTMHRVIELDAVTDLALRWDRTCPAWPGADRGAANHATGNARRCRYAAADLSNPGRALGGSASRPPGRMRGNIMAKSKPKQGRPANRAAERRRTKGPPPRGAETPTSDALEPSPELGRGRGRPTKFRPEFVPIAAEMCRLGATDMDLATAFGVTTATIWHWKSAHAAFLSATSVGKEAADERIEASLYHRAHGYSYNTEKVFLGPGGQVIRAQVVEHVPPCPTSMRLWLTNRRPAEWRDSSSKELTGPGGGPIEVAVVTDKREIARRILFALAEAHLIEHDKATEGGGDE